MIRVFVDFDGTITRADVGDAMFERFGGEACTEAVASYRAGGMPAVECFTRECAACGAISRAELDRFLDNQEIDETFGEFLAFCRSRRIECCIVSDGMDYYIGRILRGRGFGDVPFVANRLELVPAGEPGMVVMRPSFPHTDEVCDRCACCKRNHMMTVSADDDILVYVGEGYSDRCPARYADVVFAKDELLEHCRKEGLPHEPYSSFGDVAARLGRMLGDGGRRAALRKRRRGALARRELYLGG